MHINKLHPSTTISNYDGDYVEVLCKITSNCNNLGELSGKASL